MATESGLIADNLNLPEAVEVYGSDAEEDESDVSDSEEVDSGSSDAVFVTSGGSGAGQVESSAASDSEEVESDDPVAVTTRAGRRARILDESDEDDDSLVGLRRGHRALRTESGRAESRSLLATDISSSTSDSPSSLNSLASLASSTSNDEASNPLDQLNLLTHFLSPVHVPVLQEIHTLLVRFRAIPICRSNIYHVAGPQSAMSLRIEVVSASE